MTWDVDEEESVVRLTIFGPNYVTGRLEEYGEGAWHGRS
jgi:hypothetical protein